MKLWTKSIVILVIALTAGSRAWAADWTGWETIQGGTENQGGGLDMSHTQPKKSDTMFFKFRNRFSEPVTFEVEVTTADSKGSTNYTTVSSGGVAVQPGAIKESGGNWAVGQRLISYRVKELTFPGDAERARQAREQRAEAERAAAQQREQMAQRQREAEASRREAEQRRRELQEKAARQREDIQRQREALKDKAAERARDRADALQQAGDRINDGLQDAARQFGEQAQREQQERERKRLEQEQREDEREMRREMAELERQQRELERQIAEDERRAAQQPERPALPDPVEPPRQPAGTGTGTVLTTEHLPASA